MKKILLTGFEPFGGNETNPSAEAVKMLALQEGTEIKKLFLPVLWGVAAEILCREWDKFKPDAVIMTGLAGGSDKIRIERVGINLCGKIRDNNGLYPDGKSDDGREMKICENAPDAYFSSYDYEKILNELKSENIPAAYSFSAGTYLCNYLLFTALCKCAESGNTVKAGFIHVPYASGQSHGDAPSMGMTDIVRALELTVKNAF